MISILFTSLTILLQSLAFGQIEQRTPASFDGDYGGCQGNFVYRATADKTKALLVYFDSERLKISRRRKAYQIGSTPGLEVLIEDYGRYKHNEYCSDFIPYPQKPRIIYAVAGTVTIYVSKELGRRRAVSVRLKDVSFAPSSRPSYYVQNAEMKNVGVNWGKLVSMMRCQQPH